MSTPKFTPGPWRKGHNDDSVVSDHPVRETGDDDHVAYYGGYLIAESISQKNIPLIAKAPEMYERLEWLAKVYFDRDGVGAEIRQLLAEARGEVREETAKAEGGAA